MAVLTSGCQLCLDEVRIFVNINMLLSRLEHEAARNIMVSYSDSLEENAQGER